MKKNHNSKNHDPANQCVTCGNEMPLPKLPEVEG